MRNKKSPHIFFWNPYKAAAVLLSIIGVIILYMQFSPASPWWKFRSDGEIFFPPIAHKGQIYIGTSYGSLYSVNQKTGTLRWRYTADHAIASSALTYANLIIVTTEDGSVRGIHRTNGNEVWRFSTPNLYAFAAPPVLRNNTLFVADTAGSLYAIDPTSGKSRWIYVSPTIAGGLTSLSRDTYHLAFHDKAIYFKENATTIAAVAVRNGKLLWRFDTKSPITTHLTIDTNRLLLGVATGQAYAINTVSGAMLWTRQENAALNCVIPVHALYPLINSAINAIRDTWGIPHAQTLLSTLHGRVILVNASGKQVIWKQDTDKTAGSCPTQRGSSLYRVAGDKLEQIDVKSGNVKIIFQSPSPFTSAPFVKRLWIARQQSFLPVVFGVPAIIIGNADGTISAINGRTGGILWQSNCFGQLYTPPIASSLKLFYACTDGGLYTVSLFNGARNLPFPKTRLTREAQGLGNTEIIEFTLSHAEDPYTNPFDEVTFDATFTQGDNKPITLSGFYYDHDTWKLRFRPPQKGTWNWSIVFTTPLGSYKKSGTLVSGKEINPYALSVSEKNPHRLTLDGKTIFNGIGIGDSIKDTNQNGIPLDDWFIGEEASRSTSDSTEITTPSVDLETYATTYSPSHGGFNIFRWSIANASFNLWDTFSFQSRYFITEGKYGDSLAQTLTKHDFHIWLTLFGFSIPFSETQSASEMRALDRYVRYIIARYGAYVSMWEIANEAFAPDNLVEKMANTIKSYDPLQRPIAMSWDHPELTSLDVIDTHKYETENLPQSDLRLLQSINAVYDFNKPILFGEIGNASSNWDKESAIRLRVKSWVAFFNEAILVFWNQSANKNYYNPVLKNANMYIGQEERTYIRALQRFTQGVGIETVRTKLPVDNREVRSYALESNNEVVAYFFHFANPYAFTTVRASVPLRQSATISWYNPSTGETISRARFPAGLTFLTSPLFATDVALRIDYAN